MVCTCTYVRVHGWCKNCVTEGRWEEKQYTYGLSDWFKIGLKSKAINRPSGQSHCCIPWPFRAKIRCAVNLANSRAPGVWFVLAFSMSPILAQKRPGIYLILAKTLCFRVTAARLFRIVCRTFSQGARYILLVLLSMYLNWWRIPGIWYRAYRVFFVSSTTAVRWHGVALSIILSLPTYRGT